MPAIHQLIPNAETLLALEPEELAPVLLQYVVSGSASSPGTRENPISRGNVFLPGSSPGNGYPSEYKDRVNDALMATWVWLEREGMLLPAIGHHGDFVFVSERGRKMTVKENFEAYKYSLLLPHKTLHPAIATSTFALFIRGHYDTVVFEAFRAVEVAVREAGKFPANVIGTDLMRKAFAPNSGPLTDYFFGSLRTGSNCEFVRRRDWSLQKSYEPQSGCSEQTRRCRRPSDARGLSFASRRNTCCIENFSPVESCDGHGFQRGGNA